MKNKNFWIILTLAVIIRLFALNMSFNDFLDWDEINSVKWNLENTNSFELIHWISENDPHPPLFHLIMRFFMNILGKNDSTYKIVIFLFSVMNCFLSFFLAGRLGFDRKRSLFFMLLFALSSYEIFDVKRVYNSFLFFSMFNIILFCDFLKGKRKWLYVISSVILIYYHFYAVFILIPEIFIIFFKKREYIYSSLISVVLFFPYLIFSASSPLYLFFRTGPHSNILWIKPFRLIIFRDIFHKYTGDVFFFKHNIILFEYLFLVIISVLFISILFKAFKTHNNTGVSVYLFSALILFSVSFIYQIISGEGILEINHITFLYPLFLYLIVKISDKRFISGIILFLSMFSLIYNFRNYEYSELKDLKIYIEKENPRYVYVYPFYYINNIPYYYKENDIRFFFLKDKDEMKFREKSLILVRRLGESSREDRKAYHFSAYLKQNHDFRLLKEIHERFQIFSH